MALTKVVYTNGVTVIMGENLNEIQDAIIALEEASSMTVDTALSTTSTNPVQNKAIANAIQALQTALAGKADSSAIPQNVLQYVSQTLTTAQQTQARDNIGAASVEDLGTVFDIKGDVATVADLPASGNRVGDVYYVQAVSAAFVWLETTSHPTGYWEEFGEPIDLSGYIEKPASPASGDFLCWNGTTWAATTVPSASGVSF